MEKVTDQVVQHWIESRSRRSNTDTPSHVNDAISRVRFVIDHDDPESAILTFFMDIITELRRSRVQHVINELTKMLVERIILKLEPSPLRSSVQASFQFWPEEKKNDFRSFQKEVARVATECAK